MRYYIISGLLVFITLLCCTPSIQLKDGPALPTSRSLPSAALSPVPSVINVPLKIRTRVLEQMLNEQLNDVIYESDTLTLGGIKPVKVKVKKLEPISISLDDNELTYRLPLSIWMQFQFTVGALGFSHTEYQEVNAGIALKFKSRIFIKNDWKLVTMTQPEQYEWLSDPVIKVRFLTIPVKPLADLLLSRQQDSFGTIVDNALNNLVDIKKMLYPLWNRIQTPFLLSLSPALWLRLSPISVHMTQLEGTPGIIRSSLGIRSVAETFLGREPSFNLIDSLPEFVIPGSIDSGFVINLYNEISYEDAGRITREYLQGKAFKLGKREVVILDIDLYGLDDYLVIGLDLTGSYRGKVYVLGNVHYDSLLQTISVENLEFDLTTKNALHNTADWLFHGFIIEKVKPFLKFPIREKLLESQLMVQKLLCNQEIAKNIFISGDIDSLAVGGVKVGEKSIQALILAKGFLKLEMHD